MGKGKRSTAGTPMARIRRITSSRGRLPWLWLWLVDVFGGCVCGEMEWMGGWCWVCVCGEMDGGWCCVCVCVCVVG